MILEYPKFKLWIPNNHAEFIISIFQYLMSKIMLFTKIILTEITA